MKDLLVYVADADAQAFLRSILARPRAVGIRELSFDIERHPLRDAGMVQSGAELARMKKGKYCKALLVWDHHGSGRERQTPVQSALAIQEKLDRFTWKDNSTAVVLVPELEQWLWHCQSAVATHVGVSGPKLRAIAEERAVACGVTLAQLQADQPKELFEHVMRDRLKRTISPYDFEQIGARASIKALNDCATFAAVSETLRAWFPQCRPR